MAADAPVPTRRRSSLRDKPAPKARKVLVVGALLGTCPWLPFTLVFFFAESASVSDVPLLLLFVAVPSLGPFAPNVLGALLGFAPRQPGLFPLLVGVGLLVGLVWIVRGVIRKPAWDWLWLLVPALSIWYFLGFITMLGAA